MATDAPVEPKEVPSIKEEPSEDKPKEPSAQPEMVTKEEAERLANERHSTLDKKIAALTRAGEQTAKAIEAAEKRAANAEAALTRAQEEREKEELERIGDKPDALAVFHAKRNVREAQEKLRLDRAEVEKSKAEHAEELREIKEFKVHRTAIEIVAQPEYKGVEASDLVELTDGSREAMEKLAKRLSGVKPVKPKVEKEPVKPDSGDASGGVGADSKYKNMKVIHSS